MKHVRKLLDTVFYLAMMCLGVAISLSDMENKSESYLLIIVLILAYSKLRKL